jgi:hypothetical protein
MLSFIASLAVSAFGVFLEPAIPPSRCDGISEICVTSPVSPYENMVSLCQTDEWACRYVIGASVADLAASVHGPWERLDEEQQETALVVWAVFAGHPVASQADALCIAWHESNLRPWAKNGHSTASGVFQHLRAFAREFGHPDGVYRFDVYQSSLVTADVVARDGNWRQWQARWSCGGI